GIYQFNPSIVNASNNTTVRFRFSGSPGNHSVVRSSFSSPCTPATPGLDSGFQSVLPNASELPEWSFTIVNEQRKHWTSPYLCLPICDSGMVFAINAPKSGPGSFEAFQNAAAGLAESVTTTTPSSSAATVLNSVQTITVGPSQTSADSAIALRVPAKHILVVTIVCSVVGSLILLLFCVAVLVIRRRRASQKGSRPLDSRTEAALLEVAEDNTANSRPEPFILHEKNFPQMEQCSATDSNMQYNSGLPTAAQIALANMAEEMRILRDELEIER
ncbi:hypothetical protein B0H19DRAFT_972132, partial [Mycena capillaripes]